MKTFDDSPGKALYYDELEKEMKSRKYYVEAVDRLLRAIWLEKSFSGVCWREGFFAGPGLGMTEDVTTMNFNSVEEIIEIFINGSLNEVIELILIPHSYVRDKDGENIRKNGKFVMESYITREQHKKSRGKI